MRNPGRGLEGCPPGQAALGRAGAEGTAGDRAGGLEPTGEFPPRPLFRPAEPEHLPLTRDRRLLSLRTAQRAKSHAGTEAEPKGCAFWFFGVSLRETPGLRRLVL
jgi:hypothetical protein